MLNLSRIVQTSCESCVEIDINRTMFLQSKFGGPSTDAQYAETNRRSIAVGQGIYDYLAKVLGTHVWYLHFPYFRVQWLGERPSRNDDDAIKAATYYFG